ncbi:MAG: PIN domain-containing protein [Beijerinckiaceae bacterium]|nr:MAG: PIN domain-containing protein [Beijerinckiaceae bacterium]
MIGLDTNILVRYFAQDDPAQSRKANALIESSLSEENLAFISVVVMVELVWVLGRLYDVTPHDLSVIIERMLQSDVFVIEHEQLVFAAMIDLKEGRGSFSDALIAKLAAKAGCPETLTFDRKASRLPGFMLF